MAGTFTPWLTAHHLWLHRAATQRPRPAPDSPRLAPHERILVRDTSADGTECVATDRALYWRITDPACQWSRVDWSAIDQVGWERATHTLHLLAAQPLALRFTGHPRLAELAAERVAAFHVFRRRVSLTPACSVTVTAVRDPDAGTVAWTVCYDPRCDTGDPAVTGAMDEAMHELRSQAGC